MNNPGNVTFTPVLAVGASTGGPQALGTLLAGLPPDFPAAVVVVQHLDPSFSRSLAEWLATQTSLPVALAQPGDRLKPGRVYLAKGGEHLLATQVNTLEYSLEPSALHHRPSVDVLFQSLADSLPRRGVAVLLTGMGCDGAKGLLALRNAGWSTIAQDQGTSAVYGMPRAAQELNAADTVLPLQNIAAHAAKLLVTP